MPTIHVDNEYQVTQGPWDTLVQIRRTVWTLEEILKLAGVPTDAVHTALRIAPADHWDNEEDFKISDLNFIKTEYLDKDGNPVRLVPITEKRSETREWDVVVGHKIEAIQ